ncbi:hypothetical protein ACOMHN_062500 [Nucella lapillus]
MECPLPQRQWKCVNCNQKGHSSAYRGCPEVRIRQKALELQAKEYMPLAVAIAKIRKEQTLDAPHRQQTYESKAQLKKWSVRSSSPMRNFNYATATKVGRPDDSAISKDEDHISFKFRRSVPKLPERNYISSKENVKGKPSASTLTSKCPAAVSQSTIHTTQGPEVRLTASATEVSDNATSHQKVNYNQRDPPLDNIQAMLDRHLVAVEERMKRHSEDINTKLLQITDELHKQSKEREEQMELAARLISKGREETINPVVQTAFDVLECVRQASQGNIDALMTFALHFPSLR